MPEDLESGIWVGEYIDANGHRGELRLELRPSGGRVTGRGELRIRTEDEPQVISGDLEGAVEDDPEEQAPGPARGEGRGRGKRVRLRLKGPGVPGPEMQYEGKIRPAGSHARQALFGVVGAMPRENFEGGVWYAWRYDRPSDQPR